MRRKMTPADHARMVGYFCFAAAAAWFVAGLAGAAVLWWVV